MEEAAAQERVRQFLLVVRGDDHDRPAPRVHGLAGLVDEELHAIEFLQQVVGKLDVGLVDLVDQQHRPLVGDERVPQFAALDVVADVGDALVAELAVAQARHRVVFVEALQRLGGRLDVPLDQRRRQRLGDFERQHGLAGAGLALDQQRPLQRDRRIDRDLQVVGRHIGLGAFETHARSLLSRRTLGVGKGPGKAAGHAAFAVIVSAIEPRSVPNRNIRSRRIVVGHLGGSPPCFAGFCSPPVCSPRRRLAPQRRRRPRRRSSRAAASGASRPISTRCRA